MNKKTAYSITGAVLLIVLLANCTGPRFNHTTTYNVDSGWASNSVNTVVFRKNALVSFKDTQFIAYYDRDRYVVVGKRRLGSSQWQLQRTPYQGNAADAHNMISIMVDGDGYLHLAWDHHNSALHYCKSISPLSLTLTPPLSMTGLSEKSLSYPEFYKLPDGDLLFFYRDGSSGRGNLVLNKYSTGAKKWRQIQTNLIDGEGKRNAYWQACTDSRGYIHISWVWRESPDVASNHDMCYACSKDGGATWQRSTGEIYNLPINAATAEYAWRIPQRSELINQTSMFADNEGNPFIATYWRDPGTAVPQYHIVYKTNRFWQTVNLHFRTTAFSLSGAGTKRIPVARPQVVAWPLAKSLAVALIFRDEERGSRISVAYSKDIGKGNWQITDLSTAPVGSWEPSYDTELWQRKKILNLFVQYTEQADGEGKAAWPPQKIQVVEWRPALKGAVIK